MILTSYNLRVAEAVCRSKYPGTLLVRARVEEEADHVLVRVVMVDDVVEFRIPGDLTRACRGDAEFEQAVRDVVAETKFRRNLAALLH